MDLKIVVPSRRRAESMPRLLSLLPSAIITVDEAEVDDYAPYVPDQQLLPHPPLPGIGHIRHWIMEHVSADFICQSDDDMRCMYSYVWKKPRKITDGAIIEGVIRNGAQICADLDLPLFGWAANTSPMNYTNCQTLKLNKWVGQLLMLNCRHYGAGKTICYDPSLNECEDGDIALQALLKSRVIPKEVRFSFDFGVDGGNPGGLQGMRTREDVQAKQIEMKRRWKGHWVMDVKEDGSVEIREIKVVRKSPLAIA